MADSDLENLNCENRDSQRGRDTVRDTVRDDRYDDRSRADHGARGPVLQVDGRQSRSRDRDLGHGRRDPRDHVRFEAGSSGGFSRARFTRAESPNPGLAGDWAALSAAQILAAHEVTARCRDSLSPPPPYRVGGAFAHADPGPGYIEPEGSSSRRPLLPPGPEVSM